MAMWCTRLHRRFSFLELHSEGVMLSKSNINSNSGRIESSGTRFEWSQKRENYAEMNSFHHAIVHLWQIWLRIRFLIWCQSSECLQFLEVFGVSRSPGSSYIVKQKNIVLKIWTLFFNLVYTWFYTWYYLIDRNHFNCLRWCAWKRSWPA